MSDQDRDQPEDSPLNPALKSTTETVFDATHRSPPPIATTSASENEGEGWPVVWLVVTVVGVILAIYFIL